MTFSLLRTLALSLSLLLATPRLAAPRPNRRAMRRSSWALLKGVDLESLFRNRCFVQADTASRRGLTQVLAFMGRGA